MIIEMPNKIDYTFKIIEKFGQLIKKCQESEDQVFIFDFSKTKFINGEMCSIIDLLTTYISTNNKNFKIDEASFQPNVKDALIRNDFFRTHGIQTTKISNNFHTSIPWKQFSIKQLEKTNNFDWSEPITDFLTEQVFSQTINWPKNNKELAVDKIETAIMELIDNIRTHSKSDKIIIGGQYYYKKDVLSFTISDTGLGLPTVVSNNPENENKSDFEKIDWATNEGTTTTNESSAGYARGLGLSTIKQEIEKYGTFTIISNAGYWRMTAGTGDDRPTVLKYQLTNNIPGTIIHLKFLLKRINE